MVRGFLGAPPTPAGGSAWHSRFMLARTPHGSRLLGSSAEGPSRRTRLAPPPHFGAPLTRPAAP
eukprot:6951028-Pyramimonas_sp.AAC.1